MLVNTDWLIASQTVRRYFSADTFHNGFQEDKGPRIFVSRIELPENVWKVGERGGSFRQRNSFEENLSNYQIIFFKRGEKKVRNYFSKLFEDIRKNFSARAPHERTLMAAGERRVIEHCSCQMCKEKGSQK